MHCKACDKPLNPGEIKYNSLIKDWEVCSECMYYVREQLNSFIKDDQEKENDQGSEGCIRYPNH